jgi:hypothetical protein
VSLRGERNKGQTDDSVISTEKSVLTATERLSAGTSILSTRDDG